MKTEDLYSIDDALDLATVPQMIEALRRRLILDFVLITREQAGDDALEEIDMESNASLGRDELLSMLDWAREFVAEFWDEV